MTNPDYKITLPCLIRVIALTGHLKRVNISLDTELLTEIDHTAKILGKNHSEFLAEAARNMLA